MDPSARRYWDQIALRWQISAPLAPAQEDVDWFQRRANAFKPVGGRALLLGVTASIATMRWPAGISLVAADWSINMLRSVWPTQGTPPASQLVCADWREMPLRESTIGLVVGDGCFTALGSQAASQDFATELRRILVPGGTILMRCFCRPDRDIDPAQLFQALHAGRFANLDLFRWLLAVSMQGESPTGVRLDDVWQQWHQYVRDPRSLRARYGWADDKFAHIDRMKGSTMAYWFPSLHQLVHLAGPDFDVVEASLPAYEWGGVFPRVELRAR